MDENSFDHLIRSKLGGYEDPVYDENAFSQFHQNYTALKKTSWLKRYRTEIIVSSALMLFTLVNGWLMLAGKFNNDPRLSDMSLSVFEAKIDSLENVIVAMQQPNSATAISDVILDQTSKNKQPQYPVVIYKTAYVKNLQNMDQDTILLGVTESFSISQLRALRLAGEISIADGNIYFIRSEFPIETNTLTIPTEFPLSGNRINTRKSDDTVRVSNDDLHDKDLSAKTKNSLERHYFTGIGINLAPRTGVMLNSFDQSTAFLTPVLGFSLDFLISPHLSIETSFEYGTTRFRLSENLEAYGIPNEPYYDFGPPDDVTITGRNISLPISLKYRRWMSPKTEFVLRGIVTPYYLVNQEYIYSYSDKGGGYGSPTDPAPIITKTVRKDGGFGSGTTVGVSAGFQKLYNKRHKIEASVFAEHSVHKMKPQQIGMQLFGLKAAYWFRVK